MIESVFDAAEAPPRLDQVLASPALRDVLRPEVAHVLEAAPGPRLLGALEGLMSAELSARERVEVCVGWNRMASYVAGARLASVTALDRALVPEPAPLARRRGSVPTTRAAADELAPALGIAPQAASRLVALARRAETELPAAADALTEGRMDPTRFAVLAATTRGMPAAATRRVEALAVRIAPRSTASQLRTRLEAEAATADPGFAARQAARGRTERDVQLRTSPVPGARRVVADLPALDAIACWQAVNACATAAKDRGTRPDGTPEERTLPELRADALTGLLTGVLDDDGLVPAPERLAELAEVQVVVAAESLRGVVDLPGTVPGQGAVSADEVRELAGLTRWRRLVADDDTGVLLHFDETTHPPPARGGGPHLGPRPDPHPGPRPDAHPGPRPDPEGGLGASSQEEHPQRLAQDVRWERLLTDPVSPVRLDHGTERYEPPPALRRRVHSRDATCIGPACEHTARGTQLDHTVDFARPGPDGALGTTSEANLGSACRRVHGAKTFGGWRLEQPTPGTFTWTSPTGRRSTRTVRPLVPGWRWLRRWLAARVVDSPSGAHAGGPQAGGRQAGGPAP